jgi:DNA-binding LacI/PurR family transcriptional regulator/DNA-binding transcriptional regulator YhcF (GntR family)
VYVSLRIAQVPFNSNESRLERPQSLLVQVEQALRRAIAERAFPEGKLPTEVELAETFGVSRETVRRAAEVLQREGLLTKYRRRGTMVHSETPPVARLEHALAATAPIAFLQADYRTGGDPQSGDAGEQVTAGLGALMLQGAIDEAARTDADVLVRSTTPDRLRATLEQLVRKQRIRGALLASFAEEKPLKKLGGKALPIVLLDHDLTVPRVSSIRDDSAAGVRLAVEHLVKLGHRRIAYVNWRQTDLNPWRLQGYRAALRAARLPVRRAYEWAAPITPSGGEEAAERWQRAAQRPTALVCFNNSLAQFTIESLERRGSKVPETVSVVGCGGAEAIGLTMCQSDWYDQGRRAMQMLLRLLEPGSVTDVEHLQIPPALRLGRTTGPPAE